MFRSILAAGMVTLAPAASDAQFVVHLDKKCSSPMLTMTPNSGSFDFTGDACIPVTDGTLQIQCDYETGGASVVVRGKGATDCSGATEGTYTVSADLYESLASGQCTESKQIIQEGGADSDGGLDEKYLKFSATMGLSLPDCSGSPGAMIAVESRKLSAGTTTTSSAATDDLADGAPRAFGGMYLAACLALAAFARA